jgi:SAM-dependent methyltransferase
VVLSRNEKVLAAFDPSMKLLELGPGYSPLITRQDGWNVFTLDHMTKEELQAKYAIHTHVDATRIQDVNFVWKGGPLDSAIGDDHKGTFDGIIASHMIEHFPDLVGYFMACSRILKEGGVLSLVVPDKRYCFDYFQNVALTGDVLEAHWEHRQRHTKKAVYNAAAYMARAQGEITWGQHKTGTLEFYNDAGIDHAYAEFNRHKNGPDDDYIDVHGWYFTPCSFRLICLELYSLGLINLRETAFHESKGCEFFVSLTNESRRAETDNLQERRMDLLKGVLLDIRAQTDFLIQGKNYIGV